MRKHPLIALTAFTALTASAIAGASTGALDVYKRQPSHQTVDGVVPIRLVERHVGFDTAKEIRAVLQPIRPRRQHLPPTAARHDVRTVGPYDRIAVDSELPQAGTDLGDDCAMTAIGDRELAPRGGEALSLIHI